jgi:hypothetical protein
MAIPSYIYNFFTNPNFLWLEELMFQRTLKFVGFDLLVAALSILLMFAVHLQQEGGSFSLKLKRASTIQRWSVYLLTVAFIILFGVYHDSNEFIYFQF